MAAWLSSEVHLVAQHQIGVAHQLQLTQDHQNQHHLKLMRVCQLLSLFDLRLIWHESLFSQQQIMNQLVIQPGYRFHQPAMFRPVLARLEF